MVLPTPGNLSGPFSASKKATIAMNWIKARLRCKCGRPSFFLRSSAPVCLVGLEKGPIAANVMSIPTNEIQVLQHVPRANGIQLPMVIELRSPNTIANAKRHFESTKRASRWVILVHDLAAHTCLTKSEFSSFAMLIVQLRTHEQFSECGTKSARFCSDHRCNPGTRTCCAIAPKGAPFSTVNAWNALRHWNAVRVEISLDRIVVKVPSSNRLPVVLMCVVCSGPKLGMMWNQKNFGMY